MKSIATLALISVALASQDVADNELMNKKVLAQLAATNPEFAAQLAQAAQAQALAQVQAPPKKKGGIGKWAGRNKEWLEPVGTKILDKVLSAFDDEELFAAADNELMNKQAIAHLAATNPEFAAQLAQAAQAQALAQAQAPPKKKGGIGKWAGRNKEWLMPVGTKLLDKVLAAFDDEELFVAADNEFAKKGGLAKLAATNPEIAEQLAQAQADGQLPPKKKKGGILKTIASVGTKVLPKMLPLLLDDNDEELFNLGGLINDGVNIYKDIKTKNYGGLVNDGIQTFKDIKQKKHDDEELFHLPGFMDLGNPVIKKHDDEELFNLGGLINDGVNIYKDVKTHNYGGLVSHGIQTVKDVKQALPKKNFLGH